MKIDAPQQPFLPMLVSLWKLFHKRRRKQFLLLLLLMFISALAEVISLGAVLPFLGVLTAPEKVFSYPVVLDLASMLGISKPSQLLLPITVLFACAALLAGGIRILLLWANVRMTVASGAELSMEVYKHTLYQPYKVHLMRNSSEVISGITNKVNGVTFGIVLPLLTLVSSVILIIAIMLALIAIDPTMALIAGICFGLSYALISWWARQRLYINSERIAREQTQVVKALQEGLGGIREVLLSGTQQLYCDIYHRADLPLRKAAGDNNFIGASPRYALEALGMVLIAALAYILTLEDGGLETALPVLGGLVLGAQRLLPALQQSYSSWTSIYGSYGQLADTITLLGEPSDFCKTKAIVPPLTLKKSMSFENIYFRYSKGSVEVLKGVSFSIQKGMRVGFVGKTGSGKSTVLDIMMGLMLPTEGHVLIDKQPVCGGELMAWQRNIAHVPQSIYLTDATIAENVAFGVPVEHIDMDLVKSAVAQAQLIDFVEGLDDSYDTNVGERGVCLSGGQRQRVGIARALYKQVSILVLDEATSALDNNTELMLMETIDKLDCNLTVIMVAHRLSTVRHCDLIIELNGGRVVAQGNYEYLLEFSPSFRDMALNTASSR